MKKQVILYLMIFAITNSFFSFLQNGTKPKPSYYEDDIIPNIIVVKYKSEYIKMGLMKSSSINLLYYKFQVSKVEKMFPSHNEILKDNESIDISRIYTIRYSSNFNPYEIAKVFENDPYVEYAEPKRVRHFCYLPNDSYYSQQTFLKKISAEQAWDITKGDSNVVIAIDDTGVDWTHPDLKDKIWINKKEIPNNGIDDDHNGYIDDVRGWDFGGLGNGNLPTPDNNPNEDQPDHGTHVAGLAAASTNNGIGISGIGFRCKIMPVKVSQNNQRSNGTPDVLYGYDGIVYAVDNGASVINCSWGGGGFQKAEQEVINYANQKGVLVVAAAGNDARKVNGFYPAAYEHCLAVAASNIDDSKASFSNYGQYVDVTAPGVDLLSTWKDASYISLSGTSMASPVVTGIAGLVKSYFPNLTSDQIAERIRISCDNIDSVYSNFYYKQMLGFGRVNAYKALTINSPSIRMTSYSLNDSVYGNNDKILEAGEKIQIKMDFINYLSNASNISVKLTTTDPFLTITKGTFNISSLNTLQTVTNQNDPFEVSINYSVPSDYIASLSIEITSGNYKDVQFISLNINPSYSNSEASNIKLTITSAGNLGYNDFPDNAQGSGLLYKKYDDILFEASLMLGVSSTKLSDAARGVNQSYKDASFRTLKTIYFSKGKFADEEGLTIFDDSNNPTALNITTTCRSFAYSQDPFKDFIILSYTLKNNNNFSIENLYSGLFFDWDIGPSGDDNITKYDALNKIAISYNKTGAPLVQTGVALLNYLDKVNYYPILNNDSYNWQIYDGFSLSEKFAALSNGTKRDSAGPGDISMVLGAGPITILSKDSIIINFVIICGESKTEILNSLAKAKEKFNGIKLSAPNNKLPLTYNLSQNFPNPFNPTTNINYSLKENGNVRIKIFDIKGSLIKDISKSNLERGEYSQKIDLSNNASGIYFYQLEIFDSKSRMVFKNNKKMILLR